MKAVGLVVEYNPFHNGHKWHLSTAKKLTGCNYAVGVMSGNFLQRGEPAMFDKWKRAEMAIRGGVDLVIELPVPFAVRSAQYFAGGAVRLLSSLGVVSHVCFGSECEDVDLLKKISKAIDSPGVQTLFRSQIKSGYTYAHALSSSIANELSIPENLLSTPNSILGVEYIRAISKFAPSIVPVAIRRRESNYHDSQIDTPFASATAIRQALMNQEYSLLEKALPPTTLEIIMELLKLRRGPVTWLPFSSLVLAKLRIAGLNFLKQLPHISEGLEYKLFHSALAATTIDELIALLKSKRYTFTRIQRLLIYVLLELTAESMDFFDKTGPLYARILGFNDNGRNLLKYMANHSSIPLITKTTHYLDSSSKMYDQLTPLQRMLSFDILATDIYSLGMPESAWRLGGWDFRLHPFYIH